MIARPKIPTQLASADISILESALSIEGVLLSQPGWAGQTAKRLQIESTRLDSPDLTSASLRDGSWIDVRVGGGELGGLNLAGSTLRRVEILRARMSGAVFIETELRDILFEDVKLNLANFRFSKLSNVRFSRCYLVDADFAGAHFHNVDFKDCDLTSADFSGASMQAADLRSSIVLSIKGIGGLKGARLSYDQMITLIPELAAGFEIDLKKD